MKESGISNSDNVVTEAEQAVALDPGYASNLM